MIPLFQQQRQNLKYHLKKSSIDIIQIVGAGGATILFGVILVCKCEYHQHGMNIDHKKRV